MNPLRLVFVTRRYWPLVGGTESVMGNLATELSARGCEVTVLTARWGPSWPARITLRGVPVVRLPRRPQGGWGTLRYVQSLCRWLQSNKDRYDLVYVSMLKHEAYGVLRAVGDRVPVVLRPAAAGRHGDCIWQLEAACGRRIKQRCMKAAAFVGASPAIERELKAAGYPRPRIHFLPDGVPVPPPRTAAVKARARSMLAEASALLEMPDWAPLAVYTGRLHPSQGLQKLVTAWRPVAARWPNGRLWLAGGGADRAALLRQIEALNLTDRVVPIGVFDDVDELLAGADLFVSSAPNAGTSVSLLEAMAAGLPVVAGDTPGNRDLISHRRHGLLVPVDDTDAVSETIIRLIDQPDLAARLGAAARQRAAEEFSLAKMVEQHVTLFTSLIQQDPNTAGVMPVGRDTP